MESKIPLEDGVEDILGKAMRGLSLGVESLTERAEIKREELWDLLRGGGGEAALCSVARVLNLDAEALVDLRGREFLPEERGVSFLPPGVWILPRQLPKMAVNAFLVADLKSRKAALFDTGVELEVLNGLLEREGLTLESVYYTHSHWDHVIERDALSAVPQWSCHLERVEGSRSFRVGEEFGLGCLKVQTRLTRGHSRGGVTYVLEGLERAVAIVGDALFARSMGGGMWSYQEALETNEKQIFTLSEETILCPGHGPVTKLRDEMRWNPFFAGRV